MSNQSQSYLSQVKQIGLVTTIPVLLFVGPAVGYFVGNWIDRKTGIFPWGTMGGVLFGFVAAVREIIRLLEQIQRDEKLSSKNK